MKKERKSFKENILQLWNFFFTDIWRITETELTNSKRISIDFIKKIILSFRGFFEDNLMVKASALTYYTLLAVIPILALIIAIGKGFGFQTTIEEFVSNLFATNKELIPYILEFVDNYLGQVQGGLFVGIGLALLLWSVMGAFRQIENNFNEVWNVKKSRSLVRQFTTYISLMIVVPVLIVISNSLSTTVDESIKSFAESTSGPFVNIAYRFFVSLLPYVVYWILFTLVFVIIPNTKVKFKHALFAGVITGTLFQIFQFLYISGQINLSKYNAVYGSFAFLPLLLFWLQISWVIVLYGAKLSFVSQNLSIYNFEYETKNISRRFKDYTTVIITRDIIQRFERNEPPVSARQISNKYNIPIRLVNGIIKQLVETEIISEIYVEQNMEKTYQPAMDIASINLFLLLDRIEKFGNENFKLTEDKHTKAIWEKTMAAKSAYSEELKKIRIRDL